MKLGLVTDEPRLPFEEAVEFGLDHGLSAFEIRGVDRRRVPDVSEHTKRNILDVILKYGVDVPSISPGTFKVPWGSDQVGQNLEERLPASLALAQELKSRIVVVFAPLVPEGEDATRPPEEVAELLSTAADRARDAGLMLALEVEDGTYAPTGEATAELLRWIDHPNLRANWDPGNAVRAGEEVWPDGYDAIREFIVHVHIKDAVPDEEDGYRFTYPGKGVCHWREQLQGLKETGYDGFLMIETHFGRQPVTTSKCIRRVQRIMEELG